MATHKLNYLVPLKPFTDTLINNLFARSQNNTDKLSSLPPKVTLSLTYALSINFHAIEAETETRAETGWCNQ